MHRWCMHIEAFKRRAGLGYIDKQLWAISDIMLVSYTTKELRRTHFKFKTMLYALLHGP